jgi:hypothetical protein
MAIDIYYTEVGAGTPLILVHGGLVSTNPSERNAWLGLHRLLRLTGSTNFGGVLEAPRWLGFFDSFTLRS